MRSCAGCADVQRAYLKRCARCVRGEARSVRGVCVVGVCARCAARSVLDVRRRSVCGVRCAQLVCGVRSLLGARRGSVRGLCVVGERSVRGR